MTAARRVAFTCRRWTALTCGLLCVALVVSLAAPPRRSAAQDPFGEPAGEGPIDEGESNTFGSVGGQSDLFGDEGNPFTESPEPEPAPRARAAAPPADDAPAAQRPAAEAGAQAIIWAEPDAEQNAKVRAALQRPLPSVGLDFTETPLSEVIEFLKDEYPIEIQIDSKALDEVGIGTDEPINVDIRNVPLKSALRLMLDALGLDYVVTDGMLLVTSEHGAQSRLAIAVYPVGDLVDAGARHRMGEDIDSLIDMLISTVATESWAENGGGESEVRPLPPGRLVISQTERVHEEIAAVLDALRNAANRAQAAAAAPADGVYTRAYALAMPQDVDPDAFLSRLIALVRKMAPPAARGGADADGRAYVLAALGDRVVVRNDREAHREVETLLSDLGLLRPPPRRPGGGGFGGGGYAGDEFGGGGFGGGGGAF